MSRLKYCNDMSKGEYRKYKRFCKESMKQNLSPPSTQIGCSIPHHLVLNKGSPGFLFGKHKDEPYRYIGMPQGDEGNIAVIGGSGSGKSVGICQPTIAMWQEPFCVTDIKGELSDFYQILYQQGKVRRPFIKFDPTQENCPRYNPFYLLSKDGEENLVNNIWSIVTAIIPLSIDDKEPFWIQSEQAIFAAALHCYWKEMSLCEIIMALLSSSLYESLRNISECGDCIAKMYVGGLLGMKQETLSCIDRGLRNRLISFAANPYLQRALYNPEKNDGCFSWDDLNTSNIFICVPEGDIEQFSSLVNLMYSQLLRHLEKRPDKHESESAQILILLDEFARFGKLNGFLESICTLRSKNVSICLILQSLAQLDRIYGRDARMIIMDNCQYTAILRTNDLDTQKYVSELIGTQKTRKKSFSENSDEIGDITSYGEQSTETREPIIYPHELATLDDVLVLSPYGFCRAKKIKFDDNFFNELPIVDLLIATAQIRDSVNKSNAIFVEATKVQILN